MNMIKTVIIIFLVLEAANVTTLYFFPGSKYANGVGVFKAWEKSKSDPEIHRFIQYLVNWVAGTKLIFILLLIIILLTADERSLFYTGTAMALSIATFFWRLFPLIRKMDRADELVPENYSAVLGGMIWICIVIFFLAAVMVVS